MPVMKRLTVDGVNYDTVGEASVTQVQTSGTKIATVTIDGTATDLYAPEGGGSSDVHCWYGTSVTVGAVLTKTVYITGFTVDDMVDGTCITIAFKCAMTAVGEMSLSVVINNKTYNHPVYYLGSITSSSNPLKSSMPNEITFLFRNSAWYFVTSSSPLVPYATGNSAGVIKVGSGLTIDSDGVLAASGGGGGGNTLELYTNSSKSVLYVDSALTTSVFEYYGHDVDVAISALQAADAIKITMSAGGVTETMFATSVFTEPIEDEYYVYFFSKGVARNISIAAE